MRLGEPEKKPFTGRSDETISRTNVRERRGAASSTRFQTDVYEAEDSTLRQNGSPLIWNLTHQAAAVAVLPASTMEVFTSDRQ